MIREMQERDVEVLHRLNHHLTPGQELRDFMLAIDAAQRVWVYEVDGGVEGFVTLSFPLWNRVCMISHLVVETKYQGHGGGRALLDAVSKAAHLARCRFLTVQVPEMNERAIRFYERNGFKQRGLFKEYLGEDNDLVWLELDLREGALR